MNPSMRASLMSPKAGEENVFKLQSTIRKKRQEIIHLRKRRALAFQGLQTMRERSEALEKEMLSFRVSVEDRFDIELRSKNKTIDLLKREIEAVRADSVKLASTKERYDVAILDQKKNLNEINSQRNKIAEAKQHSQAKDKLISELNNAKIKLTDLIRTKELKDNQVKQRMQTNELLRTQFFTLKNKISQKQIEIKEKRNLNVEFASTVGVERYECEQSQSLKKRNFVENEQLQETDELFVRKCIQETVDPNTTNTHIEIEVLVPEIEKQDQTYQGFNSEFIEFQGTKKEIEVLAPEIEEQNETYQGFNSELIEFQEIKKENEVMAPEIEEQNETYQGFNSELIEFQESKAENEVLAPEIEEKNETYQGFNSELIEFQETKKEIEVMTPEIEEQDERSQDFNSEFIEFEETKKEIKALAPEIEEQDETYQDFNSEFIEFEETQKEIEVLAPEIAKEDEKSQDFNSEFIEFQESNAEVENQEGLKMEYEELDAEIHTIQNNHCEDSVEMKDKNDPHDIEEIFDMNNEEETKNGLHEEETQGFDTIEGNIEAIPEIYLDTSKEKNTDACENMYFEKATNIPLEEGNLDSLTIESIKVETIQENNESLMDSQEMHNEKEEKRNQSLSVSEEAPKHTNEANDTISIGKSEENSIHSNSDIGNLTNFSEVHNKDCKNASGNLKEYSMGIQKDSYKEKYEDKKDEISHEIVENIIEVDKNSANEAENKKIGETQVRNKPVATGRHNIFQKFKRTTNKVNIEEDDFFTEMCGKRKRG